MGLFEFVMILLSVVAGLGLAEVLSGTASVLRARNDIRFHWLHVLFQFGVFFALLQVWWESWALRNVPMVSFWAMLMLLAGPVCLFLMAHLLYPRPVEGADLEAHYYRQAPLLWGLVVAGTVVGTFLKPLSFRQAVFVPENLSGLLTMAIGMVLMLSRKPRVHAVLAPMIVIILILDTLLPRPVISTGAEQRVDHRLHASAPSAQEPP